MSKVGPKTGRRIMGFAKSPRKGSRMRIFLRMSLRKQGVTVGELAEDAGISHKRAQICIGSALQNLLDQKGWDIRHFKLPKPKDQVGRGTWEGAYKCVRKLKWDGTFKEFGHYERDE